ncbi:FkbM family methyltransferase, partial [Pseudomonas sp. ATCC 13867]
AREELLTLHEIADTGLSTLDTAVAEQNRRAGMQVTPYQVPVRRLADICAEHLAEDRPLHFLKIDVEGFEMQVLEGMDFQRCVPGSCCWNRPSTGFPSGSRCCSTPATSSSSSTRSTASMSPGNMPDWPCR